MQLAEQEVAGNYGSAMNIWGAGLVRHIPILESLFLFGHTVNTL